MSSRALAFEHWIRTSFVQMNTELENLYFAQSNRAQVIGRGDPIKAALRDEGHTYVVALLAEGNTGEGFDSALGVLGSVGLYLGALRRHELSNPAREERSPFPEASSLALHVGASLGMAPRFSTAHLATHNRARAGVRKSFTSLADEFLFIDENTRGILSLQRAADAITSIVHLGVTNPVAIVMFDVAKQALRDAMQATTGWWSGLTLSDSFIPCGPTTNRTASAARSIAAQTPGTFPALTSSICYWACAAQMILTTRNCWPIKCSSCCRPTRHGCATA